MYSAVEKQVTGPTHIHREVLHKGLNIRGWRPWGYLRAVHHNVFFSLILLPYIGLKPGTSDSSKVHAPAFSNETFGSRDGIEECPGGKLSVILERNPNSAHIRMGFCLGKKSNKIVLGG